MAVGDTYDLDENGNPVVQQDGDTATQQRRSRRVRRNVPPSPSRPIVTAPTRTGVPTPSPDVPKAVSSPTRVSTDPIQQRIDNTIAFQDSYVQSPMFRERLRRSFLNEGQTQGVANRNVSTISALAGRRVDDVPVHFTEKGVVNPIPGYVFDAKTGSHYHPSKDEIWVERQERNPRGDMRAVGTTGHEIGHSVMGVLAPYAIPPKNVNMVRMGPQPVLANQAEEIRRRLNPNNIQTSHDASPEERRGDVWALRGLLNDLGIYDARTQVFTREHLRRAQQELQRRGVNAYHLDRLLNLFKTEDDVIWAMNHIAQNPEPNQIPDNYA